MKVEIQSIADKGIREKERIILKAVSDTDIGDYLLIQAGFSDGQVTVGTYQTYWFPYKAVSAGDLIVVYTKSGNQSEKELRPGRKAHFFYWGIGGPIWDKSDRAPVLLHAPEWISKSPDQL